MAAHGGDSGEDANVHRLKTQAEEKYASGDLNSAIQFAKRAHSQRPNLDGLSEMLAAFKILRTAAASSDGVPGTPDYYKILQVERFSRINGIKKQYRKLALTLHPDKKPFAACEDAFKVVAEAFRVLSDKIRRKDYDLKLTMAMQSETGEEEAAAAVETFRTACSNCRLVHKFDRKYVGQNLMCPNCNKSFKAVEASENSSDSTGIGSEDERNNEISGTRVSARIKARKTSSVGEILLREKKRSFGDVEGSSKRLVDSRNVGFEGESSRSKISEYSEEEEEEDHDDDDDDETMTLAEMQMLVIKKMNKDKAIVKKESRKSKDILQLCLSENESEIDGESIVTRNGKVKEGKVFKKGQVWAVYGEEDDDDGLPRHYALIHEVVSLNPFKIRLCWLQFQHNGRKTGPRMSCGRFKVSKQTSAMSANMFSHIVDCERVAREVYMVYPRKGSVWAMYAESGANNQGVGEGGQYDIVVCLTSYSEVYGLSLGYLEKVDGFRTLFKRREVGVDGVRRIGKDEIGLMSHQIAAARKVSGEESVAIGKDCWELDDPIIFSS
ncbi:hypothetical protein DM860_001890 [Cuscuta australis]|uniref:J domain-containing protein n=1 Tax=Cuscuta australis TaxID=267555 RepID=A0A328EA85_9ASTE|nr:hypothetical protein DM860_001890 [Cuscuta australis]